MERATDGEGPGSRARPALVLALVVATIAGLGACQRPGAPAAGRGDGAPADAPAPAATGGSPGSPPAGTFHDVVPPRTRWTWRRPMIEASALLAARDHEALEALADRLRSSREKDEDGMWLLRRFYEGVSTPGQPSDTTWTALIGALEGWSQAVPDSFTARIALGHAWADYAWFARGNAYAAQVTDRGWKLFRERLGRSRDMLARIEGGPRCPEHFAVRHKVIMGLGESRARYEAMFRDAVAFEPTYPDFYMSRAYSLLPRWGGEDLAWERFARETSEALGPEAGPALYARLAYHVAKYRQDDVKRPEIDWPLARAGYRQLLEAYPDSSWIANQYLLLAVVRKDGDAAREALELVGERREMAIWESPQRFAPIEAWILRGSGGDSS